MKRSKFYSSSSIFFSMRRLVVLFVLVCLTFSLSAQSWNVIKESNEYLYGEGWGYSIAEADKQALSSLISKIAVNISSESSNKDNLVVNNGEVNEVSQFESSVNTYAQATLTNTQQVILKNEPDAHVGRWIKKNEIDKIFASRKAKINDMVSQAIAAEKKGKVDDALRNFYWALTLLKSLQYPNEPTYVDESGQTQRLVLWIPAKMNEIFDQLEISVKKKEEDVVELLITFQGKPVNSVDYTYFDGIGWSNVYSAKDGVGVLELAPGNVSENYQIKFEFEYRGQALIDRELESVLNVVRSTPMRKAYFNVKYEQKKDEKIEVINSSFSTTDSTVLNTPSMVADPKKYEAAVNVVLEAIKLRRYDDVKELFSEEGWDIYQRLIHYGSARIVGEPNMMFMHNGDYVIGRGVQMSFSFKTGSRKSFVEDIVFTFDNNNKICNLAFGLGNTAVDDILNKGIWSAEARLGIMNFLENYKTAYGLKRLDYIRSIFDDNAVIIVGNVVKSATAYNKDVAGMANNKIIKTNRYTKDQYLQNLSRCFNSNEYINIRFANNDVYKLAQGGELYAIQIAQDYYSSSYGDKGYLFLMVDINDPQNPIIKVRTWQPEKDPNFGLYGPGDF